MKPLALVLTLLLATALNGGDAGDALASRAASSTDRVIDAGKLLTADEVTALEAIVRRAETRALRIRFVTAPAGLPAKAAQARLGSALGLTDRDVLLVAGRDGAFCQAPALSGEGSRLTEAFEKSRGDFASSIGRGMASYGERVLSLVGARRSLEAGLTRGSEGLLALLVLVMGIGLACRVVWAARARRAAQAIVFAPRLEAASGLLYELGAATEDLPAGHALFLDGWRRFGAVRKAPGREELDQLVRFLSEALERTRREELGQLVRGLGVVLERTKAGKCS